MKIKVLHSETQAEVKELNLAHVIAEGESFFVGRSQNSGLVLDSSNVSRLQGKFSCEDGSYYFCDLGSSNGSMIKGELAVANQNYLLQPGDVLRIGEYVLILEEIPQVAEELPATVIGNLDTTVVAGYGALPNFDINAIPQLEGEETPEEVQAVEAEIVSEESFAIVKVEPPLLNEYDLRAQTGALFTAINQRVIGELRAAGNLTRETYLKAIRKARESVEQNTLIDSDQFEQNAEKYWQSVTRGTSDLGAKLGAATMRGAVELGGRLNSAVKAALREFVAPHPKAETPPETLNPEIPNLAIKSDEPVLNAESALIDEPSQTEDGD
jgi:predicted component of type VI protein secretion system